MAVPPGETVAEVDEASGTLKAKSIPEPVSETVCGLPAALSLMVTAPVLVPVVVGLNVTLMVQLALAATLEPQVLIWEKSPLTVMLVMLRATLPVLLSVTL